MYPHITPKKTIPKIYAFHPSGYPTFSGQVLEGDDVTKLVAGMDKNGLVQGITHILTGRKFCLSKTFEDMFI